MDQNLAEQKKWILGTHASSIVGLVIPFGGLIGPLFIRATKGKEDAVIKEHASACLRFNLYFAFIWIFLVYLPILFSTQLPLLTQFAPIVFTFLLSTVSCLVSLSYFFFVACALWNVSQNKQYSYPSMSQIFSPDYYAQKLA